MNTDKMKLCPFCESPMIMVQDDRNNGKPYLECSTCGLRFKEEGFSENPVELKDN